VQPHIYMRLIPFDFRIRMFLRTGQLRAFSVDLQFVDTGPTLECAAKSILLGVVSVSKEWLEYNSVNLGQGTSRILASLRETGLLSIRDGRVMPSKDGFLVQFVNLNHFDLEKARYWYDYCRSNHILTNRITRDRPSSLRLIYCRTHKIVQPSSWVGYAVLSCVRGAPDHGEERDGMDSLTMGDVVSDLPKTIVDSMDVAEYLDIQHLWVDRYRIDQQD
jgi:hypothetical protein